MSQNNEEQMIMVPLIDEGPVAVEGREIFHRFLAPAGDAFVHLYRWPKQKKRGESKKRFPYCTFSAFFSAYMSTPDGERVFAGGFPLCRKLRSESGAMLVEFAPEHGSPVRMTADAMMEALLGPMESKARSQKAEIPRAQLLLALNEASAA